MLHEVNADLNQILNEIQSQVTYVTVRKLVVDYTMLDMLDICIFTAFEAPKDEIFYQSQNS